jgi:predicted transcriptional regulator
LQQVQEHITRVNSKLQDLLKKHFALVKQTEQQDTLIKKLEQQNALQQEKIDALEQQQLILKSAAGQVADGDKKEFEQLINKYIREIDKCITLLGD